MKKSIWIDIVRAIICEALCGPDDLILKDVPDPVPGPGEVLIRVQAAALNFFDTLIIAGRYQIRADPPFSPGGEMVGTVDACGAEVAGLEPGARVIAYTNWGGCAEKIVVPAKRAVPIPDGISDEVAAGLLITYGTTLHALKDRANLQPGQTLAVLGASGGVGLAAIDIGRIMGARVIACASSDDKLAACRERGADALINYQKDDLKTALKAVDPRGINIVYDPVGGDLTEDALRALAWQGRLLVIGFASGIIPKLPLNLALVKGCSVDGVFWGRFMDEEPAAFAENTRQLVDWCVDGTLKPEIDCVLPLAETVAGLKKIAAREAVGKVIIKP